MHRFFMFIENQLFVTDQPYACYDVSDFLITCHMPIDSHVKSDSQRSV